MQTTPGTSLTDHATELPPRRSVIGLCLAVCAAVYALDLLTKTWAQHALADGVPRQVIGDLLRLHLTHNPGAAFSTGTSYTVVLTVIAIGVIVICLTMAGRMRSRGWAVALGLILGGALGNVTDRLFRAPSPFHGHVVDFIELPHYPIFNIADSAIFCAAILIVWLSWRGIRFDGSLVPDSRADRAAHAGDPAAEPAADTDRSGETGDTGEAGADGSAAS